MKATKLTLLVASMLLAATTTLYAGCTEGESCTGKGEKGKGRQQCGERGRGGMERGKRCGAGRMMMMKDLNLTEDQKEQMKAIREKSKEQMKEVHKALGDAHKALREAAASEDIDEAKISELSKSLADNMAEAAILKASIHKEMQALLTDEQKAKCEEKRAEMKKRMEERKNQRKEQKGKCGSKKGGCGGCDKK
jgi:periplasmic protein CpxP/Spy